LDEDDFRNEINTILSKLVGNETNLARVFKYKCANAFNDIDNGRVTPDYYYYDLIDFANRHGLI